MAGCKGGRNSGESLDLPWHPLRLPSFVEEGTLSLLEVLAAVLLGLGSVLVLRAVYLADALEPSSAEPAQPASGPTAGVDYPKAA